MQKKIQLELKSLFDELFFKEILCIKILVIPAEKKHVFIPFSFWQQKSKYLRIFYEVA